MHCGGGGGRNLFVERYKFLDSRGHVMMVQPTCPPRKENKVYSSRVHWMHSFIRFPNRFIEVLDTPFCNIPGPDTALVLYRLGKIWGNALTKFDFQRAAPCPSPPWPTVLLRLICKIPSSHGVVGGYASRTS